MPVGHTPSEERQITPSLTELAGHLMPWCRVPKAPAGTAHACGPAPERFLRPAPPCCVEAFSRLTVGGTRGHVIKQSERKAMEISEAGHSKRLML